jgi:hypothetical protein
VEISFEAPAEKIQGEIFNVGYQNLSDATNWLQGRSKNIPNEAISKS